MNVNYPAWPVCSRRNFPDGQIRWSISMGQEGRRVPARRDRSVRPFLGIVGVARPEPGRHSTCRRDATPQSRHSRAHRGHQPARPVFVKGALLWVSDGHAAQGNGEINLTAIETAIQGDEHHRGCDQRPLASSGRASRRRRIGSRRYDQDLNKALDILKAETAKFIASSAAPPPPTPSASCLGLGLPHRRSRQHRARGLLLQSQGRQGEGARALPTKETATDTSASAATPISTRRWMKPRWE